MTEESRVDSKVVLITGGSSGIGLACACRFASAGYRVAICGRSEERLVNASAVIAHRGAEDVLHIVCDVSDPVQVDRMMGRVAAWSPHLDVLVNNAGTAELGAVADLSDEHVRQMIGVNCHGVVSMTRAAWPLLGQQGGAIINVSSLASTDPFPGFTVYGATKAFVDLFSKSAADEGQALGIRVYSLCPGAVETPLLRRLFPDLPMDQTSSPEEVAERIFELAQDSVGEFSGQAIQVML